MRVLLVEDYAPLRQSLAQGLREAGFAVDTAGDGQEALWRGQGGAYDVIVLDLMLPKLDGLTVLQRWRQAGCRSCVLVLTARDTLEDRVRGLDAGADDYLVKPFALAELLARVRAMVRRKYETRDPVVRVGDLEVDTTRRQVRRGGAGINLTSREYALLEYLALRAGELVTRADVWEHVYDFRSDASSNVVDVYIGYLRRKIEREGLPRLIHTRRGQGYILSAQEDQAT